MQDYIKFLRRLPKRLKEHILAAVGKIARNELKNLDIKPLTDAGNIYRCRVGKIRIVFEKRQEGNIICDIGFRGNIYH